MKGLVGILFLIVVSANVRSDEPPPLVGWMPIQFVSPGETLTLDMRRFIDPGASGQFRVVEKSAGVEIDYDTGRMILSVVTEKQAKGFVEIPWELKFGDAKPLSGVLTLALQSPESSEGAPVVFASERRPGHLVFDFVADRPLHSVSVVAQSPDGTSHVQTFLRKEESLIIPTAGLSDEAWVRVAVVDESGKISRPARATVAAQSAFQWQDGVIYYAFTDRFVNGDRRNDKPVSDPAVLPQANWLGGDFEGIGQRIEEGYFKRLGINVLWLAPLNRNPDGAWKEYLPPYRSYTGYHGYWPVSATEVEPRFGGESGLKNLVKTAHDSGVRLIADLVLRHVHVDNPLWSTRREWFGRLELPDGRKNLRIWDEHQFSTWFEEWLPGFDFDQPEAVSFLLENAAFWSEGYNLDGFRLDAVKHIQPSFWWKFRSTMRGLDKPERPRYYVGETFMDRRGIMQFVGPNMLDGQFDFPLYDTILEVLATEAKGFDELERSLLLSETIYGKETLMSPLVGNHDKSRFMAFADGDLPDPGESDEEEVGWRNPPQVDHPDAYDRLKMALGFILSIDGVPMIYYGDEVGLTGAGDPDNRRMMPDENHLKPEQRRLRAQVSKVAHLRQAHPALRYGHRRLLVAEQSRYAFVRRHFEDRVVMAWNRANQSQSLTLRVAPELSDGKYWEAISGQPVFVKEGLLTLEISPRDFAFVVPTTAKPRAE